MDFGDEEGGSTTPRSGDDADDDADDDDDDDDDEPRLSACALAALREFYAEQEEGERGGDAEERGEEFPENWQLSQFWYSEETATALAAEAAEAAGPRGRVACVCAPSVFRALLRLRESEAAFPENSQDSSLPWESSHCSGSEARGTGAERCGARDVLLEFDERFAALARESFVRYDYRRPLDLAAGLGALPPSPLLDERGFSLVLLDPPYLSDECLEKVAVTARFLARDKIVLCTGAVMSELACRELGVRPCRFVPRHQNQLANEFRCFANYALGLDRGADSATAPPPPPSPPSPQH